MANEFSNTQLTASDIGWRDHLMHTLRSAIPLAGAQIAFSAIGIIDILMIGRLGVSAIAATGLATIFYFFTFIAGIGLAQPILTLASRHFARHDEVAFRRHVRMGMWICLFYTIGVLPFYIFVDRILLMFDQQPELVPTASSYSHIMYGTLFWGLLCGVMRSCFSAIDQTRSVLIVSVTMTLLNIVFNYIMIYGNFGFPALGVEGAALASMFATMIAFLQYVYFVRKQDFLKKCQLFTHIWRSDWDAFRAVLSMGWPISIAIFSESFLFGAAGIMIGWIGSVELASHTIVVQICSITFMVPLAISFTANVRIAKFSSLGNIDALYRATITLVALVLLCAGVYAVAFLIWPEPMITSFLKSDEPGKMEIITYSTALLIVAAAMQLGDTMQVLGVGLLRGLGDTKIPMVGCIIAYWGLGIPAGYLLLTLTDLGGIGVWIGLVIGVSSAAIFNFGRFYLLYRQLKNTGSVD